MNENNGKKGNYYSALTGWRRAVPIILAALATFVTVCFFTDNSGSGALGKGISSVLLGLFSYGAYAIPVLLIVHAIFYAEDYSKRRTVSRIIFSVTTVFFISTIEYAIVFWGQEYLFTPGKFYTSQSAGGFLGSIIAFLLVKLLGSIGVIILATSLFAIYITFFFAGNDSAFGRLLLTVLGAIASFLAKIERGIKKLIGAAKNAKTEKNRKRSERISAELLDDQFFSTDGSMREVKVKALGIHQDHSVNEENPTLQTSVFHKSATNEPSEPMKPEEPVTTASANPTFEPQKPHTPKKNFNLSFDIPTDEPSEKPATEEEAAEVNSAPAKESKAFYGIDAPADEVFTQSFNPFDFVAAEKLASKASSRAQKREPVEVEEIARPVSARTSVDEDREREARLREFEEKRRALKEMHERELAATAAAVSAPEVTVPESSEEISIPEETTAPDASAISYTEEFASAPDELAPIPTEPEESYVQDNAAAPSSVEHGAVKTVEFNISSEPRSVYARSPIESSSFSMTFEKQEYAPASATVEQDSSAAPVEAPHEAAEPVINEYTTAHSDPTVTAEFKSFPWI